MSQNENPQKAPISPAMTGVASGDVFAVGDTVKIDPKFSTEYEVAEIRRFPHGFMVGIYDEPPSKHVDFWNEGSLTIVRKANHPLTHGGPASEQ